MLFRQGSMYDLSFAMLRHDCNRMSQPGLASRVALVYPLSSSSSACVLAVDSSFLRAIRRSLPWCQMDVRQLATLGFETYLAPILRMHAPHRQQYQAWLKRHPWWTLHAAA